MKIGFIGGGNMASAIYRGMIGNGVASANDITVYDIDREKLATASKELGIVAAAGNSDVVEWADMIFLAVKPQYLEGVISDLPDTGPEKAFVSIVAGWDNARLKGQLGADARVLRVLPNTPLMAGQGMTAICTENDLTSHELEYVVGIFSGLGRVIMASEKQIPIISAISGSGPAYGYIFIEALADAACLHGIARDDAYTLAAQTLLGSGKMVLDTGMHPGQLKDAVCSPGGTTIEAVYALEKNGFRAAVIDAVDKANEKFHKL